MDVDPRYRPVTKHETKKFNYSGLSVIIEAGMQKKITRFSVGPKLLLPIYTEWKKDATLIDEFNPGRRDKWFNGFWSRYFIELFFKQKINLI